MFRKCRQIYQACLPPLMWAKNTKLKLCLTKGGKQ
uniref:Uncharacterized protein n=1 Tax=Siphoviridae sp. ctgu013 TaxID=2826421 RepID=A0A8S5NIG9_9CAUD|nr:MAG TPA: hypothetical protein [Siphoviridae sp. ctgu013]